jgi:hypothetical protein
LKIVIILGEEYKSRRFSLDRHFHPPVSSSLFSPSILLSTLFSNTLNLCKIWGFHGGDSEEWCILGCYALWLL